MMRYLLAHDIGTSGDKATLFAEDGTDVYKRQAHAQAFNMSYYPGAERLDNFTVRLCSKDFMDILRFIHFAVIPLRGGEFDQD